MRQRSTSGARPRALGAGLALGLAASLAYAPAGAATEPAPMSPATPAPRKVFASPLVSIERIDAGTLLGRMAEPAALRRDNVEPPPIYLLDPDGFTNFGQVQPPEGGQLIMLVE